jgi:hypothetical protein
MALSLLLIWQCGRRFAQSARPVWLWCCMALLLAGCYYLVLFIVSMTG